jgi:hypothetical protein
VVATTSSFGCSRYSERIDVPMTKLMLLPFARAFERHPSIATWDAVHRHMRLGALEERSQTAIVKGLTRGRGVPPRLMNAAAVDLATYAWNDSLVTVRRENVMARRDPASSKAVARTARLAWLLLALRAGYVDERIDLSKMDLRDPSRFVGQSMNLSNIDFSESRLTGTVWHGSNLTRASFDQVAPDGALACDACIWTRGGTPLRKTFVRGRWVP